MHSGIICSGIRYVQHTKKMRHQ